MTKTGYWTFNQFKMTREKINPVSAFYGKQLKDNRPLICQYIDALVTFLVIEDQDYAVDLDFSNM